MYYSSIQICSYQSVRHILKYCLKFIIFIEYLSNFIIQFLPQNIKHICQTSDFII